MRDNKVILAWIAGLFLFAGLRTARAAGASSALINSTVSISSVASGGGTLYDVLVPTGAVGEFSVCFDSANAAGLTAASGSSIWTVVTSSSTGANTGVVPTPQRAPATPINFNNGLSCVQSATTHRTQILFRTN